jgi:transcriptional regulator PpsR
VKEQDVMRAFASAASWLNGVDVNAAAALIAAATDVAVVIDAANIIRDVAFQSDATAHDFMGAGRWVGRSWRDTVTAESRAKIDEMLREVRIKPQSRGARQVNYPVPEGKSEAGAAELAVMFTVLPVGTSGLVIAVGRDLRAFGVLQQRVVDVQQSFERDFAKMRHIETRYRILFQMTPEPVLIADATSFKIIEANPAARELAAALAKISAGASAKTPAGSSAKITAGAPAKIIGMVLHQLFKPESAAGLDAALATVNVTGRADRIEVLPAGDALPMNLSACTFRQGSTRLLLVRLDPVTPGAALLPTFDDAREKMLKLVERVPDGFVVTEQDGRIVAANEAFLEMTQLRNEGQARGQSLERWIGRPGVDLGVLLNNLRQHGLVRLFSTTLRDEFGAQSDVEISAGAVINGGETCYGFAIRGISRRVVAAPATTTPRAFPKSLEQIIELIGRVSLKELVRETTDVIERLSIEAALTMTGDNRASAAEVLGVSRQSLYVKMRRHGLIDAEAITLE